MKQKKKTILIFLGAAALALGSAPLRADDVTDSVDEAMKAYKDGDYATAAASLDTAAQMIRQKRAESFAKFLPAAPSGWTAEDATTGAAGAAMFGGAVTAERRYSKGEAEVTVKFLTDSPMMSAVMMMMNNPMLLSSSENGKMERIKGQKALVKQDGDDGEISIVVSGVMLVSIEGNGVTAAEMKGFAEGIDYAKLAASL
ncbi:MAG: hypothetical protein IAE82_21065 [Opitutaceae bacterium]|nr:hypothetical protein [Opitutaceae bacterium]